MNCAEWEERIALHAGGELTDGSVERHLAECPGCQVFASGMRQTVAALRADEREIGEAHYAAVRARVMAEVGRARRRWIWVWAAAAVCTAVVAGVGIERRMRVEELPMVARAAPVAPPVVARVRAPESPAVRAVKRAAMRHEERQKNLAAPEEVLVKIETDDPDVVLYWITETKGEYR